ncbi:hypothetical protein ACS0TY_036384 [Phlomoides rotata]
MKARRLCELCPSAAAVFCPSDAAFLCWSCDAKIHEVNFLVARHIRQSICSTCNEFTGQGLSGVGFRPSAATCSTCPPISAAVDDNDALSSDSSVCISSTTTLAKENSDADSSSTISSGKRRRPVDYFKAEGIFVNWCGKLGMEVDLAVQTACKVCVGGRTVLPFRVCLAASMWLGLKLSLEKSELTCKVLKRLEAISGVPARLILAAAWKLERALSKEHHHRRTLDLEEGSAES